MPDLSVRGRELVRERQIRSVASRADGRPGVMGAPAGSALHLRAGGGSGSSDPFGTEGFACVTDSPYEMRDWLGPYTEVVRSGAFTKTLDEKADVRLLLNHAGIPLARTKSGTLSLDERDGGLWHEAPSLDGKSGLANDVRSALERGDLDEMSFMFRITKQQWSPDFTQLDITEVELFDVSIVTFPANPATSVGLRGVDVEQMSDDQAREAFSKLEQRLAPPPPAATPRLHHAERALRLLGT